MKLQKLSALALILIALAVPAFMTRTASTQTVTEAPAGFDDQTNGLLPQGDPNNPNDQPGTFVQTKRAFEVRDEKADGLGPVYNAQSCAECHQSPVTGGISQIFELRAGHSGPGVKPVARLARSDTGTAQVSESFGDGTLGILLNRPEMVPVPKTLRVDLVDVLGTRWPRGEPSRLGLDLDPAKGLAVTRRRGPDSGDRLTGELSHIELVRPERLQGVLLFRRRRDVDSFIEGYAEFGCQGGKQLARIAAGAGKNFGGEQSHHQAVLVGRPHRAVALEQ